MVQEAITLALGEGGGPFLAPLFGSSRARKFARIVAATVEVGIPCSWLSAATAMATSTGSDGRSPVFVNGPSVSVNSLSSGISATIDACRVFANMAAFIEK